MISTKDAKDWARLKSTEAGLDGSMYQTHFEDGFIAAVDWVNSQNRNNALVMRLFANARYSCVAEFDDSWLHIIKADGWTAYIQEFEDEFLLTWFNSKKDNSVITDHSSFAKAIAEVQNYVLANSA